MKRLRIAVVGDNCVDRFGPPVNQSLIGGNAVNVAVQLAGLGVSSFYFGAVGRDEDGERTHRLLSERGVDVSHLRLSDSAPTAYTEVETTAEGDRIFVFEEFGACRGYAPDENEVAVLMTMDHVHLGWLDDDSRLGRRLAEAGISVSRDASINADPRHLAVAGMALVFASADGDRNGAQAQAKKLLADGAGLAVVTCGAEGSMAMNASEHAETDIRHVSVVDTTGAGDSFIAGFLSSWLLPSSLMQALEKGRDLAATTCTHVGGFRQ